MYPRALSGTYGKLDWWKPLMITTALEIQGARAHRYGAGTASVVLNGR